MVERIKDSVNIIEETKIKSFEEELKCNVDFYNYAINEYNPDNVACANIYAKTEQEVLDKFKKLILEKYKYILDALDVSKSEEEINKYLESIIYWEGEGIYDLIGFAWNGNFNICRIDSILSGEFYDINQNELVNPILIEKRFGGKVYGVYGSKLKIILVDDVYDENLFKRGVESILEDADINLREYFWYDNCFRTWCFDCYRIIERDIEDILEFLMSENEFEAEVIYVSEIYNSENVNLEPCI